MTARTTYLSTIGLFALLACGVVASEWWTRDVRPTGLHGPLGLVVLVPFLLLFAIGGLILAVLVVRRSPGAVPTVIGLLPVTVLILGIFGIGLLSLA